MRARIRSLLIFLLILAAAVAAFAWWRSRPLTVEVIHATRGAAIEAVYGTGIVEPTVQLPIAPRVAGRMVELAVDEGAQVKKGQVLARLEATDLKAAQDELDARARYARQAYERAEMLVQRGLGSVADRDRTLAELHAAEAAAARNREQMKFMTLVAPADGLIVRRDGEVGQYIAVNQPIFHMATTAPLRITADVDEEDIARVVVGQPVVIHADAFPGKVFDGEVAEVTPKGDATTRSYRVRIRLQGETPLHIGMTTEANIIIAHHEAALLLPASALADGHVWVVRDGQLARLPVQLGIRSEKGVEILSGVDVEDAVVAQPSAALRAGQRVQTSP
jgi:RND family efflux transporter MFP subunit